MREEPDNRFRGSSDPRSRRTPPPLAETMEAGPLPRGLVFEKAFRTKLDEWYLTQSDQQLDERNKIDLVVSMIRDFSGFGIPQVAIQVSQYKNDERGQRAFLEASKRYEFKFLKWLYIEADSDVDGTNAAFAARGSIDELIFGKDRREFKVAGLRIAHDLSRESFDLEANLSTMTRGRFDDFAAAHPIGQELDGSIQTYNAKRYGFIKSPACSTNFFFHKSDLEAALEQLLEDALANAGGEALRQPGFDVLFTNGGIEAGANNPRAREVRLKRS